MLEEDTVLRFPNFGKKSYEEVKQVLDSLKLEIGMPLDESVRALFTQREPVSVADSIDDVLDDDEEVDNQEED